MTNTTRIAGAFALATAIAPFTAAHAHSVYADDHAPIGVMADHAHKKGEIMFSLRAVHMEMDGNQIGTDDVSPDTIVTTIPNRFASTGMQPPTLRAVPQAMRADMYMFGMMYAPSDAVTLAVMGSYIEKEMEMTVYQGGMGTNVLGDASTSSRGFGDAKAVAIMPLLGHPDKEADKRDELYLKAGVNIPLGSTNKSAQMLTPMNTAPVMRMPYGMQLGTGTWDFEPALTYKMRRGKLGLGLQASASIKLGDNGEGYSFGDSYESTAWLSYRPAQWVSLSGRIKARTMGPIDGIDLSIMGPAQGANPDYYGGERVDLIGGVNFVATHGSLAGHRLGLEVGKAVYQDLNGPQMAADWSVTVGWQKAY